MIQKAHIRRFPSYNSWMQQMGRMRKQTDRKYIRLENPETELYMQIYPSAPLSCWLYVCSYTCTRTSLWTNLSSWPCPCVESWTDHHDLLPLTKHHLIYILVLKDGGSQVSEAAAGRSTTAVSFLLITAYSCSVES